MSLRFGLITCATALIAHQLYQYWTYRPATTVDTEAPGKQEVDERERLVLEDANTEEPSFVDEPEQVHSESLDVEKSVVILASLAADQPEQFHIEVINVEAPAVVVDYEHEEPVVACLVHENPGFVGQEEPLQVVMVALFADDPEDRVMEDCNTEDLTVITCEARQEASVVALGTAEPQLPRIDGLNAERAVVVHDQGVAQLAHEASGQEDPTVVIREVLLQAMLTAVSIVVDRTVDDDREKPVLEDLSSENPVLAIVGEELASATEPVRLDEEPTSKEAAGTETSFVVVGDEGSARLVLDPEELGAVDKEHEITEEEEAENAQESMEALYELQPFDRSDLAFLVHLDWKLEQSLPAFFRQAYGAQATGRCRDNELPVAVALLAAMQDELTLWEQADEVDPLDQEERERLDLLVCKLRHAIRRVRHRA